MRQGKGDPDSHAENGKRFLNSPKNHLFSRDNDFLLSTPIGTLSTAGYKKQRQDGKPHSLKLFLPKVFSFFLKARLSFE